MADRTLTTVLRAQTAPFDGPMLQSARVMEKFEKDARAMSRFVNQAFGQLQTPSEKLELNLQKLDAVFKAGKISAEEHSRAVQKLTSDYNRATTAAIELAKAEQTAKQLAGFNESRASLFAGESRQDLMARMSGGAAAPGTQAGGRGGFGIPGLGPLAGAFAVKKLIGGTLNRIDEVGGGAESEYLKGNDLDAATGGKAVVTKTMDNLLDSFGVALGKAGDFLTGGALSAASSEARIAKEANDRASQRLAASSPLAEFHQRQSDKRLVDTEGLDGLERARDRAEEADNTQRVHELNRMIADEMQRQVDAADARAKAIETHKQQLGTTLNQMERELEIATLVAGGMTPRAAALKLSGASDEQVLRAGAIEKELDGFAKPKAGPKQKAENLGDAIADSVEEAFKRAAEQVKQVDSFQRQFENEGERFQRQERDIKRMEAAGLSPEFAKRARMANDAEFRRSAERTNQQLAPLLVAGSREAITFMNQQQMSERDPALAKADEQIKLLREQVDQEKKQAEALTELAKRPPAKVANF